MSAPLSAARTLTVGVSAAVRVAASSANLGSGFDSLGLALDVYDSVETTVIDSGVRIDVVGEGSATVPVDDSHLVVRALRRGLAVGGAHAPGLHLVCHNAIPQSRGMGSSAAAIVAGLGIASSLLAKCGVRERFTDEEMIQLSSEFEGHPDNASASVLGSAVISWTETHSGATNFAARRIAVHPEISITVFVPNSQASTSMARGLLPDLVPRSDAVFNVSRCGLAVYALTTDPQCLFAATADRIHQHYREPVFPSTTALVGQLRDRAVPAFVSGAGPSVLALQAGPITDDCVVIARELGFAHTPVTIGAPVHIS